MGRCSQATTHWEWEPHRSPHDHGSVVPVGGMWVWSGTGGKSRRDSWKGFLEKRKEFQVRVTHTFGFGEPEDRRV